MRLAWVFLCLFFSASGIAEARYFHWFARHIKPSGACAVHESEVAASFYHSGTRTANGERFNPNGLTAASRTLPFGSTVRIRHPKNGRSITIRINDRGPYGPAHNVGVKLDLARGAAMALGMRVTEFICISISGVSNVVNYHKRNNRSVRDANGNSIPDAGRDFGISGI